MRPGTDYHVVPSRAYRIIGFYADVRYGKEWQGTANCASVHSFSARTPYYCGRNNNIVPNAIDAGFPRIPGSLPQKSSPGERVVLPSLQYGGEGSKMTIPCC